MTDLLKSHISKHNNKFSLATGFFYIMLVTLCCIIDLTLDARRNCHLFAKLISSSGYQADDIIPPCLNSGLICFGLFASAALDK